MKVGIYCRLSEEDRNKHSKEDDSMSIQNQKAMLIQYAFEQDWDIYDIYNDDDYTGADRKRPQFNRILKDAEKKNIDIILCKTQSRFTREIEYVEKYLHGLFPLWGIRFVSIVDNADTDNKENRKQRQMYALFNEWYISDMSDNVKSALTTRRKNGFHIGAFSLYGYSKNPEKKGQLIIDPEAASVVRNVFNLYADGYGKTSIARILNAEGIPNPTEYKRLHGIKHSASQNANSLLWKYYAISDMLHNEMYIGNMVQGKYGSISYKSKMNRPKPKSEWIRFENTHEPIIDVKLWEIVQRKLEANYKPLTTNGMVGLFAKKVRCMNCGYILQSSKTKDRYYLKCTTNHANKDACSGAFISIKLLESTVVTELNSLISRFLDMDYLDQKLSIQDQYESKKAQLRKKLSNMEKKREEYLKGLKSLYLDKIRGIITEEVFVELSQDFEASRSDLDKLIAEKRESLVSLESDQSNVTSKRQKIETYAHISALTRDMVEELIDYISVGKKNSTTGERQIEINWDF